jgi:hypothetical protein
MLDPVVIYYHPQAGNKAIQPDELAKLAAYFREAVVAELKDTYLDRPVLPIAGALAPRSVALTALALPLVLAVPDANRLPCCCPCCLATAPPPAAPGSVHRCCG